MELFNYALTVSYCGFKTEKNIQIIQHADKRVCLYLTDRNIPCFLNIFECGEKEFEEIKCNQELLTNIDQFLQEIVRLCELALHQPGKIEFWIYQTENNSLQINFIERNTLKNVVLLRLPLRLANAEEMNAKVWNEIQAFKKLIREHEVEFDGLRIKLDEALEALSKTEAQMASNERNFTDQINTLKEKYDKDVKNIEFLYKNKYEMDALALKTKECKIKEDSVELEQSLRREIETLRVEVSQKSQHVGFLKNKVDKQKKDLQTVRIRLRNLKDEHNASLFEQQEIEINRMQETINGSQNYIMELQEWLRRSQEETAMLKLELSEAFNQITKARDAMTQLEEAYNESERKNEKDQNLIKHLLAEQKKSASQKALTDERTAELVSERDALLKENGNLKNEIKKLETNQTKAETMKAENDELKSKLEQTAQELLVIKAAIITRERDTSTSAEDSAYWKKFRGSFAAFKEGSDSEGDSSAPPAGTSEEPSENNVSKPKPENQHLTKKNSKKP